jgi:hypothetical protein
MGLGSGWVSVCVKGRMKNPVANYANETGVFRPSDQGKGDDYYHA